MKTHDSNGDFKLDNSAVVKIKRIKLSRSRMFNSDYDKPC